MSTLITVIHVVTCVLLVIMVLIQSGKGAEISASFGGSSQTVFGSSGGANFFVKLTGALAAIFFTTSLVLTVMSGQAKKSLFESSLFPSAPAGQQAPTGQSAPATQNAAPTGQGAPAGQQQNAAPTAPQSQGAAPAQPAAPAKH